MKTMHTAKRDIQSYEDVELLVHTFYAGVRKHPGISYFFNETINDWDEHLKKLTGFWMANLFQAAGYRGNPIKAHIQADQSFNHQIEQAHFGHWLQLWCSTIDALFIGEKADMAKERARNIAHITFLKIFQARNEKVE